MWKPDEYLYFEVGIDGSVKTDISPLITCRYDSNIHLAPKFSLGHSSKGVIELAANILWEMEVAEDECKNNAHIFRDEVLLKLPPGGGRLFKSELDEWIKKKRLRRSPYYTSMIVKNKNGV